MRTTAIRSLLLAGVAAMALAGPASASVIYWTDWTSATTGQTSGSASGTIDAAGTQRLQQLSANLISARQAASGYAGEL